MNLLQTRQKFRELSGRHDLVNADYSDNGADFFINAGRKFLDRLDETQKSWASCFRFIDIGRFSAQFPYCRAIKEVWAMTTTERWRLEKMNLQDLIADYLTGLPSSRGGRTAGTSTPLGSIINGVSNSTAVITAAGGVAHGLVIDVGDTAIITSATTVADEGIYQVVSNDGTRIGLNRVLSGSDMDVDVDFYRTTSASSQIGGTPAYYSPAVTRYIPEGAAADTFEATVGFVDIPAGNAHEYNSILINVPPDVRITVDIKGLFYSAELVSDTDKNYWSEVHPSLLIMSAMRQTEVFNRNTQGVNDWASAITTEMAQLGFDLVEELIAEASSMGE